MKIKNPKWGMVRALSVPLLAVASTIVIFETCPIGIAFTYGGCLEIGLVIWLMALFAREKKIRERMFDDLQAAFDAERSGKKLLGTFAEDISFSLVLTEWVATNFFLSDEIEEAVILEAQAHLEKEGETELLDIFNLLQKAKQSPGYERVPMIENAKLRLHAFIKVQQQLAA